MSTTKTKIKEILKRWNLLKNRSDYEFFNKINNLSFDEKIENFGDAFFKETVLIYKLKDESKIQRHIRRLKGRKFRILVSDSYHHIIEGFQSIINKTNCNYRLTGNYCTLTNQICSPYICPLIKFEIDGSFKLYKDIDEFNDSQREVKKMEKTDKIVIKKEFEPYPSKEEYRLYYTLKFAEEHNIEYDKVKTIEEILKTDEFIDDMNGYCYDNYDSYKEYMKDHKIKTTLEVLENITFDDEFRIEMQELEEIREKELEEIREKGD